MQTSAVKRLHYLKNSLYEYNDHRYREAAGPFGLDGFPGLEWSAGKLNLRGDPKEGFNGGGGNGVPAEQNGLCPGNGPESHDRVLGIPGYYTQVMYQFQDQLKTRGYDLVTEDASLSRWPFDGIIACDASPSLSEVLEQQAQFRVPVVSVGAYYWKNTDFVGVDLNSGAREAMAHLVSLGRRSIVFVTFNSQPSEARLAGYMSMMSEAGLEAEVIHLTNSQRALARQGIREYVESKGCPGGIFCCNDNLAIGVHRGLRDLGIRMPEDTALVGCDGIEDTEYHDPPISTIDLELSEMCRLGCEFLFRRMNEPEREPQQIILKPKLVIRASSTIA